MKAHTKYLAILTLILLIKAIWACYEVSIGYIGLNPDEAQYWTWSQNLDWGFYSKPPGIAWQIKLGTLLFGNTELGVRLGSIIISLLTGYAIYFLCKSCKTSPLTCFFAALIFIVSPIGMLGNFAATTDGGMILFWTLASLLFTKGISEEKPPSYLGIGIMILCGSLFKWPIYILWVPIVIFSIAYKKTHLTHLLLGFFISLLGFLPSIIWNMQHEWATFRHVFTQSTGGDRWHHKKALFSGNFFDFFGAQFGVLSPLLFALLLIAIGYVIYKRKKAPPSIQFCALTCFGVLGLFLTLSIFNKMQANWALYAYPTGVIVLSWFCVEVPTWGKKWAIGGMALSLIMVIGAISIPYIQQRALLPSKSIPYKVNPFRHSLGWNNLYLALQELKEEKNTTFLFSDTYQMTSILSFYNPQKKRAYFLNIDGKRKNQFSFWDQMKDQETHNNGYYVWYQNTPDFMNNYTHRIEQHIAKLAPYFESVEFIKAVPLFSAYGTVTKGALIYKCNGYNGNMPQDPNKY